jgi:hypothetical protein
MKGPWMSVPWCLAIAVAATLTACGTSGGDPVAGSSSAATSQPTLSLPSTTDMQLEGEWHQQFTCEAQVKTFQQSLSELTLAQRKSLAKVAGNTDTSVSTLVEEFTREFAWGPNAKAATQLTPEALCQGAPDRERTMRLGAGTLVVNDWDQPWGPAVLEIVDDHTFTVNDGFENFGSSEASPTDTFTFVIDGDKLTLTQVGLNDAWAGTFLVEAPWFRTT